MPKCEHGLTSKECYVCVSPKHGAKPERHFCERCGKRLSQDGIHTCTPPQQAEPVEQKDAARWRFLVDNSFDKENVVQFHVWEHSWEPHSQTGEPTEWKQRVRGPALNRFIDRAVERKVRGEEK